MTCDAIRVTRVNGQQPTMQPLTHSHDASRRDATARVQIPRCNGVKQSRILTGPWMGSTRGSLNACKFNYAVTSRAIRDGRRVKSFTSDTVNRRNVCRRKILSKPPSYLFHIAFIYIFFYRFVIFCILIFCNILIIVQTAFTNLYKTSLVNCA